MKKTLLSLSLFITILSANAQVLYTDDFSALSEGNIGDDITGAVAGQGDWYTAVTGGANENFQIVDNGDAHGNVFQLTGSANATGTRFMWKDGFPDAWNFREAGNNTLEVEYDYFTGPATTSKNDMRIMVFNGDRTKFLGGLLYTTTTRVLSGLSYYDNAGTLGNYSFNPTSGAVALPANTWVKMGFSFNLTTGQVLCRARVEGATTYLLNMQIPGAAMGVVPDQIEFISAPGTANTVAAVGLFDNLTVRAANASTLLGVETAVLADNTFAVYPNPASNFINVSSNDSKVTSVSMADLNGRIVKQVSYDNVSNVELNISDLASGLYLMNIKSDNGEVTKKIMKD